MGWDVAAVEETAPSLLGSRNELQRHGVLGEILVVNLRRETRPVSAARPGSAPKAVDSGHRLLWLVLGGGVGLSLSVAIMSAVTRNQELAAETREPPWLAVQTSEQVRELRAEVAKLKQIVDIQRAENQMLRLEIATVQSQIQEIKSPTPVGHAGPVLIRDK